jgi:Fe-S cluster biosynthesis and repair protein YggX
MSCCGPNDDHGHAPAPPPPPPPGTRMVKCVKLGKELPGMSYKPYQNELGQKIYDQVSKEGWKLWTETAKMILNEYRLNLASPEAQKFLFEQAEKFFFGPGAQLPPEFTPMAAKK